ncbi:hypothetical protein B1B04_01135 [Lysinibacillus sp. KCTC 33748]|uniref:hypothetical protein n=1 Tax=unclassified Lysinibacillus TaxID=2636778 RepID=UPI0009A74927|nr:MULTISPECIES: hypothetical protein [unclassified Lysinibacillus]OXS77036.1 hypothetical protein B1B04_01135 [Lysinibacillus sp. KCTC 33748]SKB29087.1 hypothetical protein SAMN06295926_101233 [Lysinibacillus sp. AC-3]
MIEQIQHESKVLAIVIHSNYQAPGITFVTPNELSQQLAYMNHPKGKIIEAHVHNPVPREVIHTQEVLFIKKGKLRVDFYDEHKNYFESRILSDGDTILLIQGGHGFEVLEEIEMIEVKQGPYIGEEDKTRFEGVAADQIKVRESSE